MSSTGISDSEIQSQNSLEQQKNNHGMINGLTNDFSSSSSSSLDNSDNLKQQIMDGYNKLKNYLMENFDAKKVFYCLKRLSFLFSYKEISHELACIDTLYETGILEYIVENIESFSAEKIGRQLQNACLWFIANVMALLTEQQIFDFMDKHPLLNIFYMFLKSDDANSIEQALWSLANFVSYIPIRDIAIEQGIVPNLIDLIFRVTDDETKNLFSVKINRTLTWLISNLCRKPSPSYEIMTQFLPYLATMIHSYDNQILRDSCLAIGNMVLSESNSREDDQEQIEEILSYNIGDRAILLTQSSNSDVAMGSLVLLGHLTYGNEQQTQYLIDVGILEALKNILRYEANADRKKEALFCLSNIVAGSAISFADVIESNIMELVKTLAQQTKNSLILEECLICFINATFDMSLEQAQFMYDQKLFHILIAQYKMKSTAGGNLTGELKEAISNIVRKVKTNEIIKKLMTTINLEFDWEEIKQEQEQYIINSQQQQQ